MSGAGQFGLFSQYSQRTNIGLSFTLRKGELGADERLALVTDGTFRNYKECLIR